MKNLFTLSLLLLNITLFAQDDKLIGNFGEGMGIKIIPVEGRETTNEEYNYMTMGIPESMQKGLDIKKNYTLNGKSDFSALEKYQYKIGYYSFAFAELLRKDNFSAGTVVKIYSGVSNNTYYVAIPRPYSPEQDVKFKQKLSTFDGDLSRAFFYAYIQYIRLKLLKQP